MRAITCLLLLGLLAGCGREPPAAPPALILATTTSVQDSGLLDEVLPAFTKKTGIPVKPIAVGSGEAIAMGRRGAADVLLTHSPEDEKKLVEDGIALDYATIMSNHFLLVGPAADPAKVAGAASAREAFERVRAGGHRFVSRGDRSGTHKRELALWGAPPSGEWYIQSGTGMGETLLIADQKSAYTLADIATFLAFRSRLELAPLFERGDDLLNRYSVMRVKGGAPHGAELISFIRTDALPIIREFGKAKYGRPLFEIDEKQ